MPSDDEDRVFDVSKPDKVSPSATSKPIIVGHHPIMNDPMVTGSHEDEPEHPVRPLTHVPVSFDTGGDKPSDSTPEHAAHDAKPSKPAADVSKESFFLPAGPAEETKSTEAAAHKSAEIYPLHEALPVGPAPASPVTQPEADTSLSDLPLPTHHGGKLPTGNGGKRRWLQVLLFLLVALGVYALLDAKTSVSLPFYVFRKTTTATQTQTPSSAPTASSQNNGVAASSLPAGFTAYQLSGTTISFDYPTAWGAPAVTTDPGFGQRGSANKSDGTYAYLVNFATNKDVQLAFSSSKYLPAARAALYYDFLQWCVGTNDGKFYESLMHFVTSNAVDTPSTITCDQGPLTDATKLDAKTIVQLNTKAADSSALGDLYTKNLTNASLPVMRVKDAAMSNGKLIKTLLGTVKIAANSSTGTTQQ